VTLPDGVLLRPLQPHRDDRGTFTELFRAEWGTGVSPVQWNAVVSEPGVVRGVHVHPRHDDYLVLHAGRASIGLRDLRDGSPTEGLACMVELDGDAPAALAIPHGVAHGFYFAARSVHIYAVSHYWDTADELGCHWADPALELDWPDPGARCSTRDAELPPLAGLLAQLDGRASSPAGSPSRP
jgi:dTDP-4-dehydrorhamnose 3,5-epimerase